MKSFSCSYPGLFILTVGLTFVPSLMAAEEPVTVAIFDFDSKEESIRDSGMKAAAMLSAQISSDPNLVTVERAELDKVLSEQELGLSGVITPQSAAKVGQLTGAKILVTGRVFRVEQDLIMVAKIIGTENGRVYGEMVKGPGVNALANMATELGSNILNTIRSKRDTLVVKIEDQTERIAALKKQIQKPPPVKVTIVERHYNGPTIDPAAETEFVLILKSCGFTVLESNSTDPATIEFKGEALSELGLRKGNLVSCKGRVELKAVNRADGRILQVDRQTSVMVDVSEQMAAKAALQKAAQELAIRMLPKLSKDF